MLPTIATGNVGSALAGEYEVANSLRFNDDDDARLSKTLGTPTNRDKYTLSVWVKRSTLGANSSIFTCYGNPSNQKGTIRFDSTDKISAYLLYDGGWHYVQTSAVFRDVSAWYHIVVAVDTTQSTDTNRIKLYVNGSLATIGAATYPSQNEDTWFNAATEHQIGSLIDETEDFDGYMAEFVFIDGQQLDPTSFGEFDEDSGIWKPIDVSGLTFGTNGFYLDFENSGSLGADVSGNGNNFTVNNLTSIDQSTDTCTNNFATINPLDYSPNPATLQNGNLSYNKSSTGSGHNASMTGTLGVTTGKWYYEFKPTNTSSFVVGMIRTNHDLPNSEGYYANDAGSYSITNGGKIVAGSESSVSGYSYSANDIFGMAYDLDNGKFYVHVNGTYITSGDPTSGSTGTGSLGNIALGSNIYVPFVTNANYDQTNLMHFNFGSPPYSVSSPKSDGNGYGAFSYTVPSGYYALNTKNLAEYG